MDSFLEVNTDKKPMNDIDMLFNKNKISNEIASLSSLSSLSSRSSIKSDKNIKKRNDKIRNEMLNTRNVPNMNMNMNTNNIRNNRRNDDDDDDDDDNDDNDDYDDDDDVKSSNNDDNDDDDEDDDEDDDDDDDDDDEDGNNLVNKKRDEISEKREILYQLNRLKSKGYNIPYDFNMSSDLNEMKHQYDKIVRDKDIDASVRFQRKMLMAFVTGTEYLNTRYDPFAIKLDGWSEQIHENITDYDDIFEELHDKYKAKGRKMAPELRLFISLSGSAFMFHLTSKMFKESSIPGVEEVFKANPELMKQFQSAAAKQFIYKNVNETSNEMNNQRQQGNKPQMNNGGGLFGMIGNLFGGLNNSQPSFNRNTNMNNQSMMNRNYRQPTDKSVNDINSIINNVHNKISPHINDDNKIETLSISDEEITSIIEDATDVNILKKAVRGKNKRTLNI
jgi:hypothetical protein